MGQRTCSVKGCGEPHAGKGYCAVHYQHWYRWGDPLYYAPPGKKDCDFPGCTGKHDFLGYCSAHAKQLQRGEELRPLRPMWRGAPCTADESCGEPIVAQGYCHGHWRAWRKYGDPFGRAPAHRRPRGKYTLNEAYFEDITTEEQAYWLGFITADGCVLQFGVKTYSLRVELAARDGAHVQCLADALGSNKPLGRYRSFVSASFDSWRLVESLGRLGITPRKSATVQPWAGPGHLMRHYWRGMFDGDGCICEVRSQGAWSLAMCGSQACVEAFAHWAWTVCDSVAQPRHVKGGCWNWATSGTAMPKRLAGALYADSAIALPRKKERANRLSLLELRSGRRPRGWRSLGANDGATLTLYNARYVGAISGRNSLVQCP